MKRILAVLLCLALALSMALCVGCSEDKKDKTESDRSTASTKGENNETSENNQSNNDADVVVSHSTTISTPAQQESQPTEQPVINDDDNAVTAFIYPVDAVKQGLVDYNDLDFYADDDGRIINCSYTIGLDYFSITYTYSDTAATIMAFDSDSVLVAMDEIPLIGGFDSQVGMVEHSGYYFYGYAF